jgi:hypothetical protein
MEPALTEIAHRERSKGALLDPEFAQYLVAIRSASRLHQALRAQATDATDATDGRSTDVPPKRRTLTPGEVAGMSGLTVHGVAEARRRGRLPGIRIGSRWVYEETEVEKWLADGGRNGEADE